MRRALGMAGMILAVIGLLFSLGVVFGSWYVRHATNNAVAQAIPIVNDAVAAQSSSLTRLESTLTGANADIATTRARVSAIVDSSAEGVRSVADTVGGTVDRVLTPVRAIRSTISAVRGSLMLFATAVNTLPSLFNLPTIPTGALEELDARANDFDEMISGAEQTVTGAGQTLADARAQANAMLDTLQKGIATVTTATQSANDLLHNLQRDLPAIQSRINRTATWFALIVTLLALCMCALFGNLFYNAWEHWQLGSHAWTKSHTTATTTETRTEKLEHGERTIQTVTVVERKATLPEGEAAT